MVPASVQNGAVPDSALVQPDGQLQTAEAGSRHTSPSSLAVLATYTPAAHVRCPMCIGHVHTDEKVAHGVIGGGQGARPACTVAAKGRAADQLIHREF